MNRVQIIIFLLLFLIKGQSQNTVGLLSVEPSQMTIGYNLIYPNNQSSVFLIDNCGRVVHEWIDLDEGRPGAHAMITKDGNLLRASTNSSLSGLSFGLGGSGGIVDILNWDGDIIYQTIWADSVYRQHHEVLMMPNGNILMVVWRKHNFEDIVAVGFDTLTYNQTELWTDSVIEINPQNDSIVWEWHSWDHLVQDFDPSKLNYGVVEESNHLLDINYQEFVAGKPDLFHINSIDYHEGYDQILLSSRNFNEIWIIDHSTSIEEASSSMGGNSNQGGDLLFRWGNPAAFDKDQFSDQKCFFQHDAEWIDDLVDSTHLYFGSIRFYNNFIDNAYSLGQVIKPEFDTASKKYLLDANDVFLPLEFEKTYSHPDTTKNFSSAASSIQHMPNGHVIMHAGRQGRAFELDNDQMVVWEYLVPFRNGVQIPQGTNLNLSDNFTFQLKRYLPSFPGFLGKDLQPGNYLELDPNVNVCPLVNSIDLLDETKIQVFPNPVRRGDQLNVVGDFNLSQITIIDAYGRIVDELESHNNTFTLPKNIQTGLYHIILNFKTSSEVKFFKILIH